MKISIETVTNIRMVRCSQDSLQIRRQVLSKLIDTILESIEGEGATFEECRHFRKSERIESVYFTRSYREIVDDQVSACFS